MEKKSGMVGKTVKFALGTRESLKNCDKILQKVEIYIDGESGILYVVPEEEGWIEEENPFLKDIELTSENLI